MSARPCEFPRVPVRMSGARSPDARAASLVVDTSGRQIHHPRAMGQRAVAASERIFASRRARPVLIFLSILIAVGQKSYAADTAPATQPTVASLVPAAT